MKFVKWIDSFLDNYFMLIFYIFGLILFVLWCFIQDDLFLKSSLIVWVYALIAKEVREEFK